MSPGQDVDLFFDIFLKKPSYISEFVTKYSYF